MDFTITIYEELLNSLIGQNYMFLPFSEFISTDINKTITLRHDVDKLPFNSLKFAKLQHSYGIRCTYYFRCNKESWDESIIIKISELGHEIGYHYEDMSIANLNIKSEGLNLKKTNDEKYEKLLADIAIERFEENLNRLREIVPVKTICMHGSPLSRWDSRRLWKYYNYREFDIIGEPYFDIDFNKVLYLTDTGRRWDGNSVNIRDRLNSNVTINSSFSKYRFHSTFDIIKAAKSGILPEQIMMTFHPQRWSDKPLPWAKELILQNTKNIMKFALRTIRNS